MYNKYVLWVLRHLPCNMDFAKLYLGLHIVIITSIVITGVISWVL